MTISQINTEERKILNRLCDDLAARYGPFYKTAHTILKVVLDAPANNELLDALVDISCDAWSGESGRMNSIGRKADQQIEKLFPDYKGI